MDWIAKANEESVEKPLAKDIAKKDALAALKLIIPTAEILAKEDREGWKKLIPTIEKTLSVEGCDLLDDLLISRRPEVPPRKISLKNFWIKNWGNFRLSSFYSCPPFRHKKGRCYDKYYVLFLSLLAR